MSENRFIIKDAVKKEFEHQWNEVLKTNPLVAVALIIKEKKVSKDLSRKLSSIRRELGDALRLTDWLADSVHANRISFCISEFNKRIGRAQNDGEVRDAFDYFGRCFRGELDIR